MLSDDELRALADALDPSGKVLTHPGESALQRAAAHLRAQADAQPVATLTLLDDMGIQIDFRKSFTLLPGQTFFLYTHPAPAAPHGDASRMIDALQSIRAHVEHDPSALAAAIVATCDSVLDAAPQAEPMADSDADYWLRNRQPILDAIERAGFMLMSNASGFWLHPRGATEAQAEPKREALTDEQADKLIIKVFGPNADLGWHTELVRAVERAHGIGGSDAE